MTHYNKLSTDARLMVWLTLNPQERTYFVLKEAGIIPEACGYCGTSQNPNVMCQRCYDEMRGDDPANPIITSTPSAT